MKPKYWLLMHLSWQVRRSIFPYSSLVLLLHRWISPSKWLSPLSLLEIQCRLRQQIFLAEQLRLQLVSVLIGIPLWLILLLSTFKSVGLRKFIVTPAVRVKRGLRFFNFQVSLAVMWSTNLACAFIYNRDKMYTLRFCSINLITLRTPVKVNILVFPGFLNLL